MRAFWRLTALTVLLTACSSFREMFPRHEDVFTPVPLSLGEQVVRGADTTYTLAGPGYLLVARSREPLPDAKTALESAEAGFRRYFDEEPPTVVVSLRARQTRAQRADSSQRPDTAALVPPDDRPRVTVFVAPPDFRDPRTGRMMMGGMGSWMIATPVVRAWLSARAERAAPRTAATGASGTDTAMHVGPGTRDDSRIPDWLETALIDRIAGSPRPDFFIARLATQAADKPEILIPLRTLLGSARPVDERMRAENDSANGVQPLPGAGTTGARRPGRQGSRGELLSGPALFDAEAASLFEFIVSREGMAFGGSLADALFAGGTIEDALRGATRLPKTVDELDRAWRSWLDTQRPERRR